MCQYIYTYIYIYVVSLYAYIYTHMHVHMYTHTHPCMYACMHAWMYVRMYVCISISALPMLVWRTSTREPRFSIVWAVAQFAASWHMPAWRPTAPTRSQPGAATCGSARPLRTLLSIMPWVGLPSSGVDSTYVRHAVGKPSCVRDGNQQGHSRYGLMHGNCLMGEVGYMYWRRLWTMIASLALLCFRLCMAFSGAPWTLWIEQDLKRSLRGAMRLGRDSGRGCALLRLQWHG